MGAERYVLPSQMIAERIRDLKLISKDLRGTSEPQDARRAENISAFATSLTTVLELRGEFDLVNELQKMDAPAEPGYEGGRAIDIPFLPDTGFVSSRSGTV